MSGGSSRNGNGDQDRNERIRKALAEAIHPDVRAAWVSAIRGSYRLVAEKYHNSDDGCDERTFGTLKWRFIDKRLADHATQEGERYGLLIYPRPHVFWLEVMTVIVAPYRIPSLDDIGDSFPLNDNGATQLAERNMAAQHDLFIENKIEAVPGGIVLAHQGTVADGCTGIFLLEPVNVSSATGRICEWGYRETLWRADSGGVELLPQSVVVPRPPVLARAIPDAARGK